MENYWKTLESKKPVPKFVDKINIIEFDKLKKSINCKNEIFVKNFARRMYNGEAFIVRNAAKKNLKKIMLNLAKHYDKKHLQNPYSAAILEHKFYLNLESIAQAWSENQLIFFHFRDSLHLM